MSVIRILSVALLAVLAGCNMFNRDTPRSQQLGAEAFYRPVPGAEDRHDKSADRSGAIREAYLTPAPAEAGAAPAARAQAQGPRNPATIPSDLENRMIPPASTTQPADAVSIAATLPPLQPGQFQLVGAVVVDVSGTAIYADKVLQQLASALSQEAKQTSLEQFRVDAARMIREKVDTLIQDELLFRQANKELSAEDKERANLATMNWRDVQIRQAGGSIELARRQAVAVYSQSLEERVQDYYRVVIRSLWWQKRVVPRVPITVDEMSRYYEMKKADEFSVSDAAQFRVIKTMVNRTPGDTLEKRRSNAQDKIKQLREQVVDRSDEDFAKVASQTNDDPVLMKNGGRLTEDGWMKKGEYRVSKVEEALWKLQPGQVTDVIPDSDSYYIARLSDRKIGHTLSFEDPEVQLRIVDVLRRSRGDAIQQQELKKMRDDAVVFPATPRYEVVLNMVMQKYPVWAAGGK